MAFWGELLWPLQAGPRGSSSDEADERAELCRAPQSPSCAGGTRLSALLSDFSHHRQFCFKGAAALKPLARCTAAVG